MSALTAAAQLQMQGLSYFSLALRFTLWPLEQVCTIPPHVELINWLSYLTGVRSSRGNQTVKDNVSLAQYFNRDAKILPVTIDLMH